MKETFYRRKVNYYETDQMGIVHHSNYIRFFEEARLDMMEQVGMDYAAMEETGLIIPVLGVNCQYVLPFTYGDEMEISTKLVKFDGLRMEFSYEIRILGEDRVRTTGSSSHCFLNQDMKPVRMKREYPKIYQLMNELVG